MRSGWVGPSRVVLGEVLPHEGGSGSTHRGPVDPRRRHVVCVLIGTSLFRCSVYSVRPATDEEEKLTEFDKSLVRPQRIDDLLPTGRYTDLTSEVPGDQETENDNIGDLSIGGAARRSCPLYVCINYSFDLFRVPWPACGGALR